MIQKALPDSSVDKILTELAEKFRDEQVEQKPARSTLIEFPGRSKPVPEWRRQLSQRVREVQERKAREAAEEMAAAIEAGAVSCSLPSAQLELVPDLDQPAMNPIVSKALQRLEKARRVDMSSSFRTGLAAAPALAEEEEPATTPIPAPRQRLKVVAPPKPKIAPTNEESTKPEPQLEMQSEVLPGLEMQSDTLPKQEMKAETLPNPGAKPELVTRPETEPEISPSPEIKNKSVRIITDEVEEIALSYLDSCLGTPALESDTDDRQAGLARRMVAGSLDLMLTALMVSPFAAAIEFDNGNWTNPRVIGVMTAVSIVTLFAYLTLSIAVTGRTLAMRLFRTKAIDVRTGLIPTGGQAIKRAIGYIFSLAILGLGLMYALVDPDGRTAYDRFSDTIVVRA